ncbi:MAG TPA: 4Fe-4S ferredoxin [bacterium]|nr:4Fe-4S ferredoxin [bacterium]HPN43564.1 4Fe-4S ferredoxin [bacterium]
MINIRTNYCPQNHPCPVVKRCPVGALSQTGFTAPVVDEKKCTNCGKCSQLCHVFQEVKVAHHCLIQ